MPRVSVVSRKVTVKIGDAEKWWLGCRDKIRLKKAKIPVRLVLSRVPFKYEKFFCLFCATDCPMFIVKGKIVSLPSDVINRSKSID